MLWRGRGFNLDEGERGSRSEGFVLVLDLVGQVLLHPLLLENLLLAVGAEQDARGDGDGHCVLRLRLPNNKQTNKIVLQNADNIKSRWWATLIEKQLGSTAGEDAGGMRGMDESHMKPF